MTKKNNCRQPSPDTQHPLDKKKISNMVDLEDKYYSKKFDIQ